MASAPKETPVNSRMLLRKRAYCMIMPVSSGRIPSDSWTGETHTLEDGVQMSTANSCPRATGIKGASCSLSNMRMWRVSNAESGGGGRRLVGTMPKR